MTVNALVGIVQKKNLKLKPRQTYFSGYNLCYGTFPTAFYCNSIAHAQIISVQTF